MVNSIASQLADWALELRPTEVDLDLAQRSLKDTVAVAVAARNHPIIEMSSSLGEAGRWAVASHILDFDDLHMESTTHVSAVCVPAALASGGDARTYLAAAGVMCRLGNALGWPHYSSGWHSTCTSGAPAVAAGSALSMGLNSDQIANAILLALPAASGFQRSFGSDAKSLQVGFAVDAGYRAARLASKGAKADPDVFSQWFELLGGSNIEIKWDGVAVPGGLAIKSYPCCYAMQRPISAVEELREAIARSDDVDGIDVRTFESTVTPLIHHSPKTGLESKFSIEYAIASSLLHGRPGFSSFEDEAVSGAEVQDLMKKVHVELIPGGDWLLEGVLELEVRFSSGRAVSVAQHYPPGSPLRPLSDAELDAKLSSCLVDVETDPKKWTWSNAASLLKSFI